MTLLARVREALDHVDLGAEVGRSLPDAPDRWRVVAIGKAAPEMLSGAVAAWGDPVDGLVVAPEGTRVTNLAVPVVRAAHPLPDARSVDAAERCLQIARSCATDGTPLLVLISGGASALVCAPANGVTLADKRAVTEALLRSGATIHDVNRVRRRLSTIKNGWLAHAAGEAKVVTRIVSDVIGGTAADVGSGPTVPKEDTASAVHGLLRRFAPRLAALPIAQVPSVRPGDVAIVVSPESVARSLAHALEARELAPSVEPVEALAAEYVALAERAKPGAIFVRAAEPAVTVPKRAGQGGRSTHLAALVARALPPGATFLALATDGVDGASGTSGAMVRGGLGLDERRALDAALAKFDTGAVLSAWGCAIDARPTGRNFADLHVLAIDR